MTFEQLSLPVEPHKLARRDGPETSKEAAASINTSHLEQIVLGAIMMHTEGATQDDVLQTLSHRGYAYSSVTARFRSLLDKKLVLDTGEKRKGKSGRSQRVLKVRIN